MSFIPHKGKGAAIQTLTSTCLLISHQRGNHSHSLRAQHMLIYWCVIPKGEPFTDVRSISIQGPRHITPAITQIPYGASLSVTRQVNMRPSAAGSPEPHIRCDTVILRKQNGESLKGIVHPKLKRHPFSSHCCVNIL